MLDGWVDQVVLYLPKVLAAVLIFLAGIWCSRFLREAVTRAARVSGLRSARAYGAVAQGTVLVTAAVIAVHQIGVDLSFLTIIVAIVLGVILFGAALAFGLGANEMAGNIIACHFVQKLYPVGAIVEIDGIRGVILEMSGAFVILETKEGQISIPARTFSRSVSKLIDVNKTNS